MVIWDGVSKNLMIKDLSGEMLGRMALIHKPARISQADRQHWIDRTLPEGKTVFGRKDFYKGLRLAAKNLDFPSHMPLVQKLVAGEDGRIWVLKSNGAEGQRWIELNPGEDPVELSLDKGRVARHFGKTSYAVVAKTRDDDEMIEIYAYK